MASSVAKPKKLVSSQAKAEQAVRPITENEVAFFEQNGWVLLKSLVSPDLCRAMLERGKPRMAELLGGDQGVSALETSTRKNMTASAGRGEGTVIDIKQWVEWRGAVRDARDPAFCEMALDRTMGRNVRRLLGRDKSMRVYHDILTCKLPDQISTPTAWHQDATNFPLDRNVLTAWVALDEITPEQGPVQFYCGSHRGGLLGNTPYHGKFDIVDEYPELARFPVSPAHHLQPGDCTVHHGLTVHGASANCTSRQRWSYLVSYFADGTRYTGAPNHDCEGLDLKVGYEIEHPSFPLVAE